MALSPVEHSYDGMGIECGYRNDKWVVSIKNWTPDNDIDGLRHLEQHHQTDEQFILISGKAALITAQERNEELELRVTKLKPGTLYTVPVGSWFFTILERSTKMMIVQDVGCTAENSEYVDLTERQIAEIQGKARNIFA